MRVSRPRLAPAERGRRRCRSAPWPWRLLCHNWAVVDLRSDTLTQPTAGMRAAIAAAVVGDEQKREDPTVLELEERTAALLGQEAAVYLPTATMANQIALRILGEPGDEFLAEEHCHILLYELGGPAVHSGLVTRGLPGDHGRLSAGPDSAGRPLRRGDPSPADPRRLAREHAQRGGRPGLAARRDRRGDADVPRAGLARPPRRRPRAERSGRVGGAGSRDRPSLRHGHALPLEGARLPARRPPRRLAGADARRAPDEVPLRRRHAPGRDRRSCGCARARAPRRPARRRPRARPAARGRPGGGGSAGRSRPGRDELRPGRRGGRRADERRGDRAPRRRGRPAVDHDSPERAAGRHAPRRHRRGHRAVRSRRSRPRSASPARVPALPRARPTTGRRRAGTRSRRRRRRRRAPRP